MSGMTMSVNITVHARLELEVPQGLLAVTGLDHGVAELAQGIDGHVPDPALRPRPPARSVFRRADAEAQPSPLHRRALYLPRQVPRQVDLDRGAVAGLGVDLHVAAGLLDEAEDLAEAEAGALAAPLVVKNGSKALRPPRAPCRCRCR